ncbi:MAG: tetratricopeptide repeat protein [bacterium]
MKSIHFAPCFIFFAIVLLSVAACAQQSPDQLFQAGIYAEEIKGDLQEALKFYQKIVRDFPDHRPAAAKAQLHLGLCYEKLGQPQAREAYQKAAENYPDQREVVAIARDRLARLKTSATRNPQPAISPLVKYYFERFGIDITTSTSYDGKYLAYTDWTTGSLMIADLRLRNAESYLRNPQSPIRNQKFETKIVAADLLRSPQYAYYPAWSRDGRFIAYSWYRGAYFIELRVVSVADGQNWVVYSDPQLIINPHDWSPDGKTIACETINFHRESHKWLALVSVDAKELQQILPLVRHSRGMKFSPDGKYVVYDLQGEGLSFIHVVALADRQQTEVDLHEPGNVSGYDAPAWSPDGNLLLCRSFGRHNLLALPMHSGKPAGKSYLVQSDLPQALLAMKGINHAAPTKVNRSANQNTMLGRLQTNQNSFAEEFSSPVLDSAWSVFEWKGSNVYNYPSFGRYSLTDQPGHLRYYLDPIMTGSNNTNYLPKFSGWYWAYPSPEISRPLHGDHWVLEARVTYSLVDGANGRGLELTIYFDPTRDRQTALLLSRYKEIHSNALSVQLLDYGTRIAENENYRSPSDTLGVTQFTYYHRIWRADTLIQVEISENGTNFRPVFSHALPSTLRSQPQLLALTGNSWFVPAGAYADWDYIRFRNADF